MFIAALFTIAKGWGNPSVGGWMADKQWVHPHSGTLFRPKKEVSSDTMWTNLEDVILSERSQTQKDKHCVIPLTGGPWRSQSRRDGT